MNHIIENNTVKDTEQKSIEEFCKKNHDFIAICIKGNLKISSFKDSSGQMNGFCLEGTDVEKHIISKAAEIGFYVESCDAIEGDDRVSLCVYFTNEKP